MKFAVLAFALAAATMVSATGTSSAASPSSTYKPIRLSAEHVAQVVKAVKNAKQLYEAGAKPTELTEPGYSHEALLYDFYGAQGKPPAGAKATENDKPDCVDLGLCDL